jgi:hypothetical protein
MEMQNRKVHIQRNQWPRKPHVKHFYRDYREGEKSYEWFQKFKTETHLSGWDGRQKAELFEMLMIEDKEAGNWWEGPGNSINKSSWTEIEQAFRRR